MPDSHNPERAASSPQVDIKRLSLVAGASRNMILILDDTGAIQWANPCFEEYTGYQLPDISGEHPKDLLNGPATDPEALKRIAQKLHRTESFEEDVLLYTRSGMPFWVHLYCVPIGKDQGVAPGFIAIMNNISDRKHSERAFALRPACLIVATKPSLFRINKTAYWM